ncbi:hypothetical protein FKM82_009810 [Ascaphus truei]
MYTEKMIRKVAKVGALRVSPNEEAVLLKQERERRRKLRLQQVREQEKSIAQQIRQDVKQRRDQQLQQLAEELRAEWQAAQAEKLKALERVYLSSLKAIGEGHRQAKENEPDFQAIEKQVAANNERAEKRYRGALRELKQHKVKQLKQQTWHIKARKKALIIEKERAANIASLPPPPPDPVENLEVVKRPPTVRICDVEGLSVSHYHLPEPYVDREMDTEQPDARASAEEEAKRLDDLQKEEERERREQSEKAHLRGSHALKMVHLQQDRDKLLKELEQMQQGDLARRRQIVAQMPPQLFEPAYRRAEIREDWQRELESVFEDMYTGDRRVRGDLVLHLQPQPLPVPSVKSADEDLDLSMEPEHVSEMQQRSGSTEEETHLHKPGALVVKQTNEAPSRLVLKRLLHKIRTQKDQWTSKNDVETASDTLESGSLPSEEGKLKVKHGAEKEEGNKAVAAAPEPQDLTANTVLAGNSILLHPQEQAVRIRMATDRQTQSGEGTLPADFCQIPKNERFQLMSALLKALESNSHEDTGLGIGSELTVPGREQRWKPSKPPVTKTKLGPLLEQHELSAIQEVETPTNGRRSSTGIVENSDSRSGSKDGTEEKYFVPTDYDPENSRMNSSSDSSPRDLDLSRISTSGKDQNSNESTTSLRSRAGRISWREALTLEATTSHDLDQSQHCLVQQGLLRYAADAEKGLLVRPTVQERFDWLGAAVQVKNDLPFSPQAHTQEASYDYLSTTTLSTGSFLTSEKTDSSPINSECLSDLQKCNYSVVGEAAYSNLSPVAANLLPHQMRWQISRSPESPRHAEAQRSHIQQIIEKYTKDLGASMERNLSFHAPFAAVDISTTEDKHFPPAFYTLEPKPDFNISTPSYPRSDNTGSSRDIKDFSQCSMYSHSQERSSPRSRVSYFQDNSNSLRSSPNLSNSQNVALATEASVKESRTLDSFESFHSLHPECTLNERNPSDQDHAMSNTATSKFSVYGLDHFIARTPTKPGLAPSHVNSHELEANSRPPTLRLSAEIPRAEREHLLEDTGSRNELMATQVTVNESALSEHPIADFLEQRNVGSSFAELPFVDQELHQEAITKTMVDDLYSHEETESQLPLGQTSHSSTIVGAVLESSNLTLKSEILTDVSHAGSSENRNSLSAFTISSSTCSLPSCIPIWETESGRGIMEEPDLTLMSFNDSSVTTIDSDPIDTMRSICDRETLSASECDFLPLPPEVDASIFTIPDCASAGPCFTDKSSSQHFAALDLDFTSSPGNLQEAFLKKKKHFIEKSSKRLEEIKQKERGAKKVDLRSTQNDTSNAQLAQSLCSGAAQADGQFKKVVEVKVCTPEDRKLSEMEMRQRTIRLYNQLDEVKTRKEERMRQESYTRNREKAKQFKKKTLENLRVRR